MGEDYDSSSWNNECCLLLYQWWNTRPIVATFAGAVGTLSEISHRVRCSAIVIRQGVSTDYSSKYFSFVVILFNFFPGIWKRSVSYSHDSSLSQIQLCLRSSVKLVTHIQYRSGFVCFVCFVCLFVCLVRKALLHRLITKPYLLIP
jgi:hypothetical protein